MDAGPFSIDNQDIKDVGPSRSARGDYTASIVICTKDRREDLARAIASIRASGGVGRAAEIVVVEETDRPLSIDDTNYVSIPPKGRGFGYARNIGVSAAQGEIILFTDDDCEVAEGWADALMAPLRNDPRILGVAGAVLVKDCGAIGYAENILGFPGGGLRYLHGTLGNVVPTEVLSTCNCSYRRKALLEVGGFPEDARLGAEDSLLAERITALGACVYAPKAVVYHRPRGSLTAVFRWFFRRGQSDIGLLKASRGRRALTRSYLRGSWTLRLIALLFLLIIWPGLIPLLPAVAIGYYAVILWRFRFALHYASHASGWWLLPMVKLTMDLGAELGRLKALLRGGLS